MTYDSLYSIRKEWLGMLGGDTSKCFESIYAISLELLKAYGITVPDPNSMYSIDRLILEKLGGDASTCYESTYAIDKEILNILGGDMSKIYDSLYHVDLEIIQHLSPTPTEYKGLTFTALEDTTIEMSNSDNAPDVKYSRDAQNWVQWDYSPISFNSGEKVYFKGNNGTQFNKAYNQYSFFKMTGRIEASGNVMSLLDDGACTQTEVGVYCFYQLFYNQNSLISAKIELPATTLANNCYEAMFIGCKNMVETIDILPATTLKSNCYSSMFKGCISLIDAPILPATNLVLQCYAAMFMGCTNLQYINANFLTTPKPKSGLSVTYTVDWVKDVAPTGIFVKNADATWNIRGNYAIPTGWDVIIGGTNAEMPATYNVSTGEAAIDSEAFDAETGTINLSKLQIMSLELDEEFEDEITEEITE